MTTADFSILKRSKQHDSMLDVTKHDSAWSVHVWHGRALQGGHLMSDMQAEISWLGQGVSNLEH